MARKSILILTLSLIFCSLAFAQEAKDEKKIYYERIHIVYFSELIGENSEIVELRNFKGEIPSDCKTEPNTTEAKVCDALEQFAKEQNIKILINGDEIRRWEKNMSPYVLLGDRSNEIDITKDFIKFYNTHFAKRDK